MAGQSPVTTAPPCREALHAPHAGEAMNGTRRDTGLRRAGPDVFGLLLVVAAAVAVMAPAVIHGASLGPFDLLSQDGVTRQPGVLVRNGQMTDLIAEMIPWTSLAWTQVHHGQLPLWNPYNALGMPLAFNWQSAPFGIPALLGYLAPLRLAYTVQVMVTLVLAGTGVYVFGRVARLGVMACVMAGVVYELSGSFMGLLGWPIASVMAWTGWLFAAALLVVGGRHRRATWRSSLSSWRARCMRAARRLGPARRGALGLPRRHAGAASPHARRCPVRCPPRRRHGSGHGGGRSTRPPSHPAGDPTGHRLCLLPRTTRQQRPVPTRCGEPCLPGVRRPTRGPEPLVRDRRFLLSGRHRPGSGGDGGGDAPASARGARHHGGRCGDGGSRIRAATGIGDEPYCHSAPAGTWA